MQQGGSLSGAHLARLDTTFLPFWSHLATTYPTWLASRPRYATRLRVCVLHVTMLIR